MPHHAFQVAVGVQAVLTQDDPGESTGRVGGAVDRQAPPAQIRHGLHLGVAEKPEQRTIGAETERYPTDPVGQPRHQRSAQADHRAAAQTLRRPADPVADGDVDTLILEVALLVGNMGDQLLVDTTPDIGQIDRLHSHSPFQSMARPPLISTQWPVMKPESSLAKKATALATSSGRTLRPIGLVAPI